MDMEYGCHGTYSVPLQLLMPEVSMMYSTVCMYVFMYVLGMVWYGMVQGTGSEYVLHRHIRTVLVPTYE